MRRVISYIDGFNLYFGLKSKGWDRYYWLDVQALSRSLLRSDQELVRTKYFTSRVSLSAGRGQTAEHVHRGDPDSGCVDFLRHYQTNPHTCRNCGYVHEAPSEKMTDVNIAVEILLDAFLDGYDTAILISADSDLIAPLAAIRRLFPSKRVVVACPPGRYSVNLCKAAGGSPGPSSAVGSVRLWCKTRASL